MLVLKVMYVCVCVCVCIWLWLVVSLTGERINHTGNLPLSFTSSISLTLTFSPPSLLPLCSLLLSTFPLFLLCLPTSITFPRVQSACLIFTFNVIHKQSKPLPPCRLFPSSPCFPDQSHPMCPPPTAGQPSLLSALMHK